MVVSNTFDLWQKDVFFSAAEEVQQSADRMESVHRTWLWARREGLMPQHLDEISRELQMALGTAKWQLQEFEKAVRQSYRNTGDDITITRHRQFVSAIEDQISCIETALKESLNREGRKPFQWVNLDPEECDDLALFLSGTPGSSQRNKNEGSVTIPVSTPEVKRKFSESGDEIIHQADNVPSNRRACSSSDRTALAIVVDSGDRPMNASVESTPKKKGFKPMFWSSRGEAEGSPGLNQKKIFNGINLDLREGHRSQRQHQMSPLFPIKSMRFLIALMLTTFLVVPFLLYSI